VRVIETAIEQRDLPLLLLSVAALVLVQDEGGAGRGVVPGQGVAPVVVVRGVGWTGERRIITAPWVPSDHVQSVIVAMAASNSEGRRSRAQHRA
jgi:hypothetical protein